MEKFNLNRRNIYSMALINSLDHSSQVYLPLYIYIIKEFGCQYVHTCIHLHLYKIHYIHISSVTSWMKSHGELNLSIIGLIFFSTLFFISIKVSQSHHLCIPYIHTFTYMHIYIVEIKFWIYHSAVASHFKLLALIEHTQHNHGVLMIISNRQHIYGYVCILKLYICMYI